MKLRGIGIATFTVTAVLLVSCFSPPEYSPIPTIEYEKVIFKDVSSPSEPDSLIITVKFRDGDGDMGLSAQAKSDTLPPFNNRWYFLLPNGKFITYRTKFTVAGYDTLPAFVSPYSCLNWQITTLNKKTDTVYFQLNKDHYNIFIDFLIQDPADGTFKLFDWQTQFPYPVCATAFHGRFPKLFKDPYQKTPMEGSIRYGMPSVGFLILFSIKTMKLRVTVQDRSLHKSNTIETPPFKLGDIKVSGG